MAGNAFTLCSAVFAQFVIARTLGLGTSGDLLQLALVAPLVCGNLSSSALTNSLQPVIMRLGVKSPESVSTSRWWLHAHLAFSLILSAALCLLNHDALAISRDTPSMLLWVLIAANALSSVRLAWDTMLCNTHGLYVTTSIALGLPSLGLAIGILAGPASESVITALIGQLVGACFGALLAQRAHATPSASETTPSIASVWKLLWPLSFAQGPMAAIPFTERSLAISAAPGVATTVGMSARISGIIGSIAMQGIGRVASRELDPNADAASNRKTIAWLLATTTAIGLFTTTVLYFLSPMLARLLFGNAIGGAAETFALSVTLFAGAQTFAGISGVLGRFHINCREDSLTPSLAVLIAAPVWPIPLFISGVTPISLASASLTMWTLVAVLSAAALSRRRTIQP